MYTVNQAVQASPVLASMFERVALSQALFQLVLPFVPKPLQAQMAAGPVDAGVWCILITNPAVATKLRHLRPHLLAAVQAAGHPISDIRLKIRKPQ
jgi:hypothetical protein